MILNHDHFITFALKIQIRNKHTTVNAMNDFFDNKISERLGGVNFGKSTVIYKFEIIKRAKAAARQEHPDIELIDMGVGEPDWPADKLVPPSVT